MQKQSIHAERPKFLLLSLLILLSFQCKQGTKSEESQKSSATNIEILDEISLDIHPISHASMVLQYDDLTIYIDPVGPLAGYESFPDPDLILITDIHGDHFSMETLNALQTEKAKLIMPVAVAEQMPESFTPQIDVLDNGENKQRFGILIEAIPMYNLRAEAKQFHEPGRGNGYVLNIADQRVYISGDTEDIPEMRALTDIDIAFVCMNLPYTMPVENAADAVLEFKPKQVYPYHYRGRPDIGDVALFKELIRQGNSDVEVVQLDWYPDASY